MFAVIKTGGKQYQVAKGDVLKIEKLPQAKDGGKVIFDQILLLADDKDKVTLGKPYLDKVKVEATLVRNFKDKKIDVLKYKNKTRYRRKYGHRQQLAEVKIDQIVVK
ncbi:MAG: 50S ribosomal protein L21 [Candidatus Komeilibacteria bacterium CG11_big_fil_rev_8_21_14_0_20_36_20]|uniref:Large ribosomal subunit protein bL21 n=1 Tax=Candidatus Komeilibacteria bacterium CG11_big_fil_rev_8_21_14_0_20_36_20 TaxID=1974477 RepID=A0A2H0NEB0_9BACT|nr:MAG: 50S ribosomal protein L21 [Candidatus Komeilibacteria bacterium CG11_big_fil_rev_8_21_14_0_20_36_20]PIR81685.1 MAG: 50S ribosomal protein L21 [Candidatus Komeilibacteria bacterium CG10_big_fil_rev_8_21_14_0_10_36_65]PJC55616.1 MAG: 50S ribosomal protein L21 [Candidatus Komeilibacteria bacterium CG_4_9_14_0_2_um_filter_36_13]